MLGDSNAVPIGGDELRGISSAIRAEAHMFIDQVPEHILLSMLPVLRKYASASPVAVDSDTADPGRITIHHRHQ